MTMNRVLTLLLIFLSTLAFGQKAGKSSKQQNANMTPEQRMVSGQKSKKAGKKKKTESTKAKVKRAKKQDKAARKTKKPKKK